MSEEEALRRPPPRPAPTLTPLPPAHVQEGAGCIGDQHGGEGAQTESILENIWKREVGVKSLPRFPPAWVGVGGRGEH